MEIVCSFFIYIFFQIFSIFFQFFFSSYPVKRVDKDDDGKDVGVVGSVQLLQNTNLATQPINSFDWSRDKMGLCVTTAFDQCLRILITTKLNKV